MGKIEEMGLSKKAIIINAIMILAGFMGVLNQTLLTPALPSIMKVPAVNIPIATKNNLLVVKRSIRNAVTGTIIPFTSIYPVVSHCAVEASTCISFIILGSAGVSSV